jgi:wyosine [tRNA(Phe)-imidazoG37] synthetase (radical SAM superfamily)
MQTKRQAFYDPEELYGEVKERVEFLQCKGEKIDYLTIVPDGEPTLDINLGELIQKLQSLKLNVAVITNCSLMDNPKVIRELSAADLVSLKVDAVNEEKWRKVNRPLRELSLEKIQNGMLAFSQVFNGRLITETMLIKDINDTREEYQAIAGFLSKLKPAVAYIAVPTRPPACRWVERPTEEDLYLAYQVFKEDLSQVEYLNGFEGSDFSFSGDIERDILDTCAVHPMRQDALNELLKSASKDWKTVEKLITEQKLVEIEYGGDTFYMRKLYEGYKR